MASSKVLDKCGSCSNTVGDKEKAIHCEICELWYHSKCEGVTDDTYRILQKDQGVHWYCRACDKGVAKILTTLSTVSKKQDLLEDKMNSINIKLVDVSDKSDKLQGEINKFRLEIENHKKHFEDALKGLEGKQGVLEGRIDRNELQVVNRKEIEQLTRTCIKDGTWADIVKKEVDGRMESVEAEINGVQKVLEERRKEADNEKDREERKNGVVLYNVPEVEGAKSFNEQADADIKFICDIMSYIIDEKIENNELKKILRLGKREYRQQTEDSTPCRPLLVVFVNGATKNYIMNSLFRLRKAEERFRKIVINHDMTAVDRAEIREMVSEAKTMEENDQSGEYIYRVRGQPGQLKIVKIKKRRVQQN